MNWEAIRAIAICTIRAHQAMTLTAEKILAMTAPVSSTQDTLTGKYGPATSVCTRHVRTSFQGRINPHLVYDVSLMNGHWVFVVTVFDIRNEIRLAA